MKLALFLSLITTNIWAKSFSNQYIEFELPSGWDCALEGSEYVCQSDVSERKREAIIILAAKVRGEKDSLDQYQAYLNQPKTYTLPGGKTQVSEAKTSAKITNVNGQQWVDALHMASEVPGFYTRYLATVKEDLGVAITFSVAKTSYESYQPIFDKVVTSMKVFRQSNKGLNDLRTAKAGGGLEDTTFIPEQRVDLAAQATTQKRASSGTGDDSMMYLLLGAAAIGFIILKKKKKS
ncbi:MAG: hypothetical protein JNM93_06035 [Bacteriovoracaceae bacterium]|nr:hypothetical protein [Bacteriovoracaceae bacterium]